MPARSPAVRVSAARDLVAFVGKYETGADARVLETFPAESLELFQSMPRSAWFPIEHDHFVVDGVVRVLGMRRAIDAWRASVLDIVDKPLFKTFVGGMLRVIGRRRVVGIIPKGWHLVYRDFCTPVLREEAEHSALIVLEDIAAPVWTHPNYFASWEGISRGLLDLGGLKGKLDFEVDAPRRRALARFEWE